MFAAVQQVRERLRLPRYVVLADGDNELLVDLDNVLSLEALAHEVRGRDFAPLVELVPAPDQLCASGPEGPFAHQVIVPFVRAVPPPAAQPRRRPATTSCARRFPPGSEWLYVKLFTGTATADQVLRRTASAVKASIEAGGVDRWFFIRYGDPDWHLRLRVHGAPDRLLAETLPLLHRVTAPMLETGQLWRVQLDTYEREAERYGGEAGIGLAEHIFHADSDAVLAAVRQLTGDSGAQLRWRVALLGIDLLFDDLGLTLQQKLSIAQLARHGYGKEFGAHGDFQREVSRRYRTERTSVEALLDPDRDPPAELAASVRALHQRSRVLAPAGQELRAVAAAGRLSVDICDMAMSLAHMHVNRMLRSAQRAQELVLYELLGRAYSSRAARRS
jgi:lantibiotic biosynthesis protein